MATPDKQLATMFANLPDKTGKPLAAWIKIIKAEGLEKHGQVVAFLKSHGVTHGFANLIASKSFETEQRDDPIAVQYSGPRSDLRPIYNEILKFSQGLGGDVEVVPKKTSVSLRRKKQFALVTPATKSRIDLGLALKGDDPQGRLEPYNAMCSHRVRLENLADFDDQVKAWVAEAYSRSG